MTIEYKKEGKIAYFTINRPEAMNAMNVQQLKELSQFLLDFRADDSVWVGILAGAGEKAFCAGADIREMLPYIQDRAVSREHDLPPTFFRELQIWKPLIAAVNGVALGGGLELVLACDLRIAAENARFGVPEVRLGVIPGWGGTQRLPRMIPYCKAAEVVLMGKPLDAQEALRIGLINKVVPQAQLMATAKEWANSVIECGPLAVRAAKEAMIRGQGMSLSDGLRLEQMLFTAMCQTQDFAEGRNAFLEKRKANFQAK